MSAGSGVVALDVGGTRIKGGVLDPEHRIVAERGKQDAERLHAEATDETPKRGRREK